MKCLAIRLLLSAALWPGLALADEEGLRSEDLVQVIVLARRVVAINPVGGPVAEFNLDLGERVVATRTGGRIGIAVTDRRLLGITSRSATWAELRYRLSERPGAAQMLVEDRVVLIPLDTRLVGLTAGAASWQELSLAPAEQIVDLRATANVALAVTDRRAIAFGRSGFVVEMLSPRETVQRTSIDDQSIALQTRYRLLSFQSGSTRWSWIRTSPRD